MRRLTIFFLKVISAKILSVLLELETRRVRILCLTMRRILPPFEQLFSLYDFENPSIRNCA